jgi:hypothetical protein
MPWHEIATRNAPKIVDEGDSARCAAAPSFTRRWTKRGFAALVASGPEEVSCLPPAAAVSYVERGDGGT